MAAVSTRFEQCRENGKASMMFDDVTRSKFGFGDEFVMFSEESEKDTSTDPVLTAASSDVGGDGLTTLEVSFADTGEAEPVETRDTGSSITFATAKLAAEAEVEQYQAEAYQAFIAGETDLDWGAARGTDSTTQYWWTLESVPLDVNGIAREFLIHTPPDYDPAKNYSVVVMYHGSGSTAEFLSAKTRLGQLADQNDFIAVFAQSDGGVWDYSHELRSGQEFSVDVDYTEALKDVLVSDYGADADAFYAAGMSNGGLFTQFLAMKSPDLFTAYASFSATLPARAFGEDPSDLTGVPMLLVHGTADEVTPYEGGPMAIGNSGYTRQSLSADETAEFWVEASGQSFGNWIDLPDTQNDGTTVSYRSSPDYAVQQVAVHGGGHSWPGQSGYDSDALGTITQEFSGTELIVDFFHDFGL